MSEQRGSSISSNDSVSETTSCHDENPAETKSLLSGILETNHENIALTREITSVLSKLDLNVKGLPNDIKEGLDKVASIMRTEKILEFDEIAISTAGRCRRMEEIEQQREERHLLKMHNQLCKNRVRLLKKLEYLGESVHSLESRIATDKNNDLYSNMMFLSAKLEEYQETAKKLETDLSDMEVEELYPEKIMEKHKLCFLPKKSTACLK